VSPKNESYYLCGTDLQRQEREATIASAVGHRHAEVGRAGAGLKRRMYGEAVFSENQPVANDRKNHSMQRWLPVQE